jgi:hypothetical protein
VTLLGLLGAVGAVDEACGFASEELLAHLPIVEEVEAVLEHLDGGGLFSTRASRCVRSLAMCNEPLASTRT